MIPWEFRKEKGYCGPLRAKCHTAENLLCDPKVALEGKKYSENETKKVAKKDSGTGNKWLDIYTDEKNK